MILAFLKATHTDQEILPFCLQICHPRIKLAKYSSNVSHERNTPFLLILAAAMG